MEYSNYPVKKENLKALPLRSGRPNYSRYKRFNKL